MEILTHAFYKTLSSNAPKMLKERRKLFSEFCKRNHNRWNVAFDLFETFIVICTEAGEEFNKSYRSTAVKENNLVFDIVVRHHARACHISQEILCLLKSGFADGAHARWRAMHEVTVTAIFIPLGQCLILPLLQNKLKNSIIKIFVNLTIISKQGKIMVNAEIFDKTLKLYGLQKKEFAQHAKIPYDTVAGWKRRGEVPEFAFMLLKKICNDLRLKRQPIVGANKELKLSDYHKRVIRAVFWGKNYTMEDIYKGIDENEEKFVVPLLKNLYAGDIRTLVGKTRLKKMAQKNKKLLTEDNYKTLTMVAK